MANSHSSLKYLHTELCALLWFSDYKQDLRPPSSRLNLGTGSSSPYVIKINTASKPTSHKKGQSMRQHMCMLYDSTLQQVHRQACGPAILTNTANL